MPRGFGKKSKLEFERLKKNARSKINRIRNNVGVDVSNDIFIPRSLDYFEDKAEFKEWKQSIESFTNRGNKNYQFERNKYGVVASKAELQEVEAYTNVAREIASKKVEEIKKKPVYQQGEFIGTMEQEMKKLARPKIGVHVPEKFNFDYIRSRTELIDRLESMQARSDEEYYTNRNEKMKENYIEMLEKAFNSDADELVQSIERMNPDDFLEMYNMFSEFDFDDFYEPDGTISNRNVESVTKLKHYMEQYENGEIDMDFRGI